MLTVIGAVLLAVAAGDPAAKNFSIGIELPSQVPMVASEEAGLRELGIDYVNYYVKPNGDVPDDTAVAVNRGMLDTVDKLKLDFSLSCFMVDPPDGAVRESMARGGARFKGIVFDELEHIRLLNLGSPVPLGDAKQWHTLQEAYDGSLAAYRALHDKYAAMNVPVTATHVWPVLLHTAARAGFTPCPKIEKEFYSTVSLAIGMGAALEYGTPLWADCDLWYYDLVPGHTPEELRSNLMLAYWLGVDRLYIEGSGHNLTTPGGQGTPFSLMNVVSPQYYQLTAHGEVLRDFCRNYLPAHPRPWTFRDLKPQIAIVNFPDTCYGQRYTAIGDWHNWLFGSPNLPSTTDTEAWFQIWNVLTFGKTGRDGISYFKVYEGAAGYQRPLQEGVAQSLYSRPFQAARHTFFVPMNGAVVFDHLVSYERLKGIPLLFLTGVDVSAATMEALNRCVAEGATLVVWGPLARKSGFPDYTSGVKVVPKDKGRYVLTDDFGAADVYVQIVGLIGRPDEIHYRFGDQDVTLHRLTDNDVAVEVKRL